MVFDETSGDELLDDVDPDLANQMRVAFLGAYHDVSGDRFFKSQGQPPRIAIYVRPITQELRIDGPRLGEEWWTSHWTGDVREALRFADDAGIAAGLGELPKPPA